MTTTLHPVKWAIEKTASGTYYAYAFGGGLPTPTPSEFITDSYPTMAEAARELRRLLAKANRRPDPELPEE